MGELVKNKRLEQILSKPVEVKTDVMMYQDVIHSTYDDTVHSWRYSDTYKDTFYNDDSVIALGEEEGQVQFVRHMHPASKKVRH